MLFISMFSALVALGRTERTENYLKPQSDCSAQEVHTSELEQFSH